MVRCGRFTESRAEFYEIKLNSQTANQQLTEP